MKSQIRTGVVVCFMVLLLGCGQAKQSDKSASPVADTTNEVIVKPAELKFPGSGEIHDAAKNGDLIKITALLKDDPNLVSSRAGGDITPLHLAAMFGHKDVVLLLLANHAEVNAKTTDGITPLYLAASVGQRDTPLHLAAGNDIAELLRQHGGHE